MSTIKLSHITDNAIHLGTKGGIDFAGANRVDSTTFSLVNGGTPKMGLNSLWSSTTRQTPLGMSAAPSALVPDFKPTSTNFVQASQLKLAKHLDSVLPKVNHSINELPLGLPTPPSTKTTANPTKTHQEPAPNIKAQLAQALVGHLSNIHSALQTNVSLVKNMGYWAKAAPSVMTQSPPFTLLGGAVDWLDLHATKTVLNSKGLTSEHDIARLSKAENFSIDAGGSSAEPKVIVSKPTQRMNHANAIVDGLVSSAERILTDPAGLVVDLMSAQTLAIDDAMALRAEGRIEEAAEIETGVFLSAVPLVGALWTTGKAVEGLQLAARRGKPRATDQNFLFLDTTRPMVKALDRFFDPVLSRIPRPNRISSAPAQGPRESWLHFGARSKKANQYEITVQPPAFMSTVRDGAGVAALGGTAYGLGSGNINVHINTDLPYRAFNAPKYSNNIAIQLGDSGAFLMFWKQWLDHRPPWGLGLDNSTLSYWRGNSVSVMPRASLLEVGGGGLFMLKGHVPTFNGGDAEATNIAGVGAFGALRFANLTNRFALEFEPGKRSPITLTKGLPFRSIVGELFASPLGVTFQPWLMYGPLASNRRGVDINQIATYSAPLKKGAGPARMEFENAYQRKQRAAATGTLNPGWFERAIQDSEPNFTIDLTNLFSDEPMIQQVKQLVPEMDLPNVRIASSSGLHKLQEGQVPFTLADGEVRVLEPEDLAALHGGQAIASLGQTAMLVDPAPQPRDFSLKRDQVVVQRDGRITRLGNKETVVVDAKGKAWAINAECLSSIGRISPERLGGQPALLVKSKLPKL